MCIRISLYCNMSVNFSAMIYIYTCKFKRMPPYHRKKNSRNFITGIIILPEDGQVMTETCRSFSKLKKK